MTPINITDFYAGDTLVMEFEVRDKRGRPVDLTGASASFALAPVIRAGVVGSTTYVLSSGEGDITFSSNVATVMLPAGGFTTIGDHQLELQVILATGQSLTAARGLFRCNQALLPDGVE